MPMRGRIQRRQGDPSRIIKRERPARPESAPSRLFGAPAWHDCGVVLVPAHGSVKIFEARFPCNGIVDKASLRVLNAPDRGRIWVRVSADDDTITEVPLGREEINRLGSLPVDGDRLFTVHLCQIDADAPVTLRADIAYVFVETASASVPAEV